ncbi:uncharacterized protein LOC130589857 [Beta vulgaris subsp. vulgaris]|uniref:uncharacterized protein LOC130589857 n=1 Tax=Beta vulgaris subsp. vulgaris TaxID=3555 RepID=UPI0025499E05|nr:uncharacterized protein LOC130589857 [Beta vulgaris subsp. vulgaris]
MEYDFIALELAGQEAEWIRSLLADIPLWGKPAPSVSMRCDSQAAIGVANNQAYNGKRRHIRLRHAIKVLSKLERQPTELLDNCDGDTPLHISTLEEDYGTSAYLLDHGADCNMAMDKGFTPLHYATKRGRTNLLCLLISKGAKVDTHARVGTPLQAAVVHGMRDVVESLLKNQANPNVIRAPSFSGSAVLGVQGRDRSYVKFVAEQLGLDGSYVSRTYIEQIQLEKLVNDVLALPDDLKSKLDQHR